MIRLIDKHGYNILLLERTVSYPVQFKQEVIDRILINYESIREVAINLGLYMMFANMYLDIGK